MNEYEVCDFVNATVFEEWLKDYLTEDLDEFSPYRYSECRDMARDIILNNETAINEFRRKLQQWVVDRIDIARYGDECRATDECYIGREF